MALILEQVVAGKTYKLNGISNGSQRYATEINATTISMTVVATGRTTRYPTINNFADFTIGGVSPTDVDDAVEKINAIVNFSSAGGAGGSALSTTTDTSGFNNNLSAADTDVQKALQTINDLVLPGVPKTYSELDFTDNGYSASNKEELAVDTTDGDTVINLPVLASSQGFEITVYKDDLSGNTVDVTPNGTDIIKDANAVFSLTIDDQVHTFVGFATKWRVK